jgi:hypothetical protein
MSPALIFEKHRFPTVVKRRSSWWKYLEARQVQLPEFCDVSVPPPSGIELGILAKADMKSNLSRQEAPGTSDALLFPLLFLTGSSGANAWTNLFRSVGLADNLTACPEPERAERRP